MDIHCDEREAGRLVFELYPEYAPQVRYREYIVLEFVSENSSLRRLCDSLYLGRIDRMSPFAVRADGGELRDTDERGKAIDRSIPFLQGMLFRTL